MHFPEAKTLHDLSLRKKSRSSRPSCPSTWFKAPPNFARFSNMPNQISITVKTIFYTFSTGAKGILMQNPLEELISRKFRQ